MISPTPKLFVDTITSIYWDISFLSNKYLFSIKLIFLFKKKKSLLLLIFTICSYSPFSSINLLSFWLSYLSFIKHLLKKINVPITPSKLSIYLLVFISLLNPI